MTPNLKELRKEKELTQKQVADMVGCSIMTYNHIENGVTTPRYKTCARIAKIFDIKPWVKPLDERRKRKDNELYLAQWFQSKFTETNMSLKELAYKAHINYTELCNIARGDYLPVKAETLVEYISAITEVIVKVRISKERSSGIKAYTKRNPNYSPFDDSNDILYVCSECNAEYGKKPNFCSNCGVRLL